MFIKEFVSLTRKITATHWPTDKIERSATSQKERTKYQRGVLSWESIASSTQHQGMSPPYQGLLNLIKGYKLLVHYQPYPFTSLIKGNMVCTSVLPRIEHARSQQGAISIIHHFGSGWLFFFGGGGLGLYEKRGRKKCRAHRWWCETWNGWRDAQRKGAFYGRDFDVWQFIIFGLFHFDCCCGMFLKFKWQHGSESESIHSRLMAVCKACPPKPKGVLTSSGTSSISPEGVSRFLRRRERQKWKIGSSMRTSICGLVGNWNKRHLIGTLDLHV